MGPRFEDYQQEQIKAHAYAATQRKINRYTFRYMILTAFSATITLLIAPKMVIPGLMISAVGYGLYRFGPWAYAKAKHAYLNWQAKRKMTAEDRISQEPLVALDHASPVQQSRASLRKVANEDITNALISKSARISHYAREATFHDDETMSYADRKHQRALFQYRMLERTKEAALSADVAFISEFAYDKIERRKRKADGVDLLLNEYLKPGKIKLTMKHVEESGRFEFKIDETQEGAKKALLAALESWNKSSPEPFITIPSGLIRSDKEKFICEAILPALLDADKIKEAQTPVTSTPEKKTGKKIFTTLTYNIDAVYANERLSHLYHKKEDDLARMRAR